MPELTSWHTVSDVKLCVCVFRSTTARILVRGNLVDTSKRRIALVVPNQKVLDAGLSLGLRLEAYRPADQSIIIGLGLSREKVFG